MEVRRVSVRDTDIQLRTWGDSGPTLFFLHSLGGAASAAFLDLGITPLLASGFQVAAPDLPGYGGSAPVEADRYGVPALADFAWAVVDSLGWPDIALIGHSWGGSIACHAAAQHPDRVRQLVLVDSGHLDYADTPGADLAASIEQLSLEAEEARLRADDRDHVARELEVDPDDPLVDAFFEGLMDDGEGKLVSRTLGTTRGASLYHLMRARQSDMWPTIAAAGIPTLLLLATVPEETRIQNEAAAERFNAALPNADIRPLEGITHSVITDLRDDFGTMVADWLTATRRDENQPRP